MIYHRVVAAPDDDLVQQGKPPSDDAVASVLKAKVLHGLIGEQAAPTVGRFQVLEVIGTGANGIVYAAYDPMLDRRVAVKLLSRPDADDRSSLLEEARTLAKLRHPNIIAVHEAGMVGQDVFIAMQYIAGGSLRSWLDEHEHEADEIVARMLGAARGLAAAHTAGIAHGDFKPDNVLVDRDGTWVADFGLARSTHTDEDAAGGGTPLYMAPERLGGDPPSRAADQFAFGVTLIEALTGERPFAGRTVLELRESMLEPPELGRRHGIPALEVALRCVRPEPADRYVDMQAVIEALEPKPGGTRRWVGPAVLAATAIAGVAMFGAVREQDRCRGGTTLANEAFSESDAEALGETLRSQAPNVDPSVVERVTARMADYREAWSAEHRAICEATRVTATQSDSLHDLRMRCLDRRLAELQALARAAASVASTGEATRAMAAVDTLAPLTTCGAERVTDRDYPSPEAADAVAAARTQLADAWAAYHLARYEAVADAAQALVQRGEEIGFGPLSVEAMTLLGTVRGRIGDLAEAEAILRRATVLGGQTASDELVADVSLQLLRTAMFGGDVDRVIAMAELVRADLARVGRNEAEVDGVVGEALLHAGRADEALPAIERALQSEIRPQRLALLRTNRASARLALGQPTEALTDYEAALAIAREHYGEGHPSLGFFEHRVGRGQLAVGRTEDAFATLTRVLEARESLLGPDDRAIASILVDLSEAVRARGETDQARSHLRRALEIRRRAYGDDHPSVIELEKRLADDNQ